MDVRRMAEAGGGYEVLSGFVCIHGPTGSGKTRLLKALAKEMDLDTASGTGILTSAESLINDMLGSLRSSGIKDFRGKYLKLNALLIDNLWILKSRPAATTELCRLFSDRNKSGCLTVVASECSLDDWFDINRELAILLQSGKCIELEASDGAHSP